MWKSTQTARVSLCKANDLDKAMEWFQSKGQEFLNRLHRDYGQNVVYFTTPMRLL